MLIEYDEAISIINKICLKGLKRKSMSDPLFKNVGTPLTRLVEECSEVIQAACKIERFGWLNYSPYDNSKTTNLQHLEFEIDDLKNAIINIELFIKEYENGRNND